MNKLKFDESEFLTHYSFIDQKPIMVDVGGHFGTSSILFAKKNWLVIAFEPEPGNYKRFCDRTKDIKNVLCINKAVYKTTGETIPFYVSDTHPGIHSLKPWHKTHQKKINVQTIRLDDALEEHDINYVSLLKIDTEGADLPVLESFDFNKIKPEIVMCEYMDDRTSDAFNYNHHDIVSYMSRFEYVAYLSEWAPIVEYGADHVFLQCVRYPLNHEPAWGNIIFIQKVNIPKFEKVLIKYLESLEYSRRKHEALIIERLNKLDRIIRNNVKKTSIYKHGIKVLEEEGPKIFFKKLISKISKASNR